VDKYKSSFLNNCYEWLFTDEERNPIGFIATFFLIIIVSLAIHMLAIPIIHKLVQ
jgi:hypothetical protein